MTRTVLVALALCASGWVGAAEWAAVPTGDGNQHFYDRSKVFVSGDEVTYWRRVVFSTAHPVRNGFARSAMYRERVSCKQHRISTLGYLLYASDGSVLENVYTPDVDPSAVVPETVGDRFHRIMCAFVGTGGGTRPTPRDPAPAPKKTDDNDSVREEIDRLETMLKRLREKVGDRPN
ncbi:MAG: hypothetical protein FJY37_01695 [Betaproteobacteria bacterium]|nr:hypothetical protein [Betaproteobacteria bacterium]